MKQKWCSSCLMAIIPAGDRACFRCRMAALRRALRMLTIRWRPDLPPMPREANARLIAAAPEMYELIDDLGQHLVDEPVGALRERACALIAKIEKAG